MDSSMAPNIAQTTIEAIHVPRVSAEMVLIRMTSPHLPLVQIYATPSSVSGTPRLRNITRSASAIFAGAGRAGQ